jgi:SAM-dependent methyltransferase
MVNFGSAEKTAAYTGARPAIIAMIADGTHNVLDVGCSTGSLGRALKAGNRNSVSVTGIEINPEAANEARKFLDYVVVGNVDDWQDIESRFADDSFDCVICADVLEHTTDPWSALQSIVAKLCHGGSVVVSLPNVGFYDTLINVFFRRRWPRRDRGLHDFTHRRWFARHDVDELLEGAGLDIVKRQRVFRLVERPHRLNNIAHFFAIPGLRDLLTYQFIVLAKKR